MLRFSLLAALALYGCGDNVAGIARSDLEGRQNAARCEHLVRCGQFADHATCVGYFRRRADHALEAAIEAGKVVYDAVSAKTCIEDLARRSCDLTSRDARVASEACDRMFTGTLSPGAACAFDEECESGSCKLPACSDPDTCCVGACLASGLAIDDACQADSECAPDGYCGADARCHALALAGEGCRADSHCDFGLACVGATDLMAGTCRKLPRVGELCPYMRCAELGAVCDSALACVAVGLPGAPCTSDPNCSPYARCDLAQQLCADIPALGMPCESTCAGEAWCDQATNRCLAPMPNGSLCESDDQCESLDCYTGVVFDECRDRLVCF